MRLGNNLKTPLAVVRASPVRFTAAETALRRRDEVYLCSAKNLSPAACANWFVGGPALTPPEVFTGKP